MEQESVILETVLDHFPQEKQPTAYEQQHVANSVSFNKDQPKVNYFEKFYQECDAEQHIGTFSTTTYDKENCLKILHRVCCFCQWLRPSKTFATHLSNKRIIAQWLHVTSETLYDNSISYAFLRDLKGVDIKKKTIPLPLYAKFPAISWLFPVLHAIPILLMLLAGGLSFVHQNAYGAIQVVALVFKLIVMASAIALIIHNQITKTSKLQVGRAVCFLLAQAVFFAISFAFMVAGFASFTISDTSFRKPNNSYLYYYEFGAIFVSLNVTLAILYAMSFGLYPYFAYPCKTKVDCVYDTVSGTRKQELRLQHDTAEVFRTALFSMKKDIVGTNELVNFPIQRSVKM